VDSLDTITFLAPGGIDIEANPSHANVPNITIQRFGDVVKITTHADSIGGTFDVIVNSDRVAVYDINNNIIGYNTGTKTRIGSFTISEEWDKNYFDVTINGTKVKESFVTIDSSSITINETAFKLNDLVDFTWNSNKNNNNVKNHSYPQVTQHNAHNKIIRSFTISETVEHWSDKLNSQPGFDGNTFGENNYESITHNRNTGGTLFLHNDIAVMNDINYSDEKLDITGSLIEQANDWDAFRERFKAQAKRLYGINVYASTKDLTEATLSAVLKNKRTTTLHNDSNMAFSNDDSTQTFSITDTSVKEFETKWTFNGDIKIGRAHV
jgi:hypothetical protein